MRPIQYSSPVVQSKAHCVFLTVFGTTGPFPYSALDTSDNGTANRFPEEAAFPFFSLRLTKIYFVWVNALPVFFVGTTKTQATLGHDSVRKIL